MIRFIVRLPMLHIHDFRAWLASPLQVLVRTAGQVLKPTRSCRDDQPECYRYLPQGHQAREISPSEFLRTVR